MAANIRKYAIGVVPSGAIVGEDGSEGVVEIKKAGGHTYSQTPETAEFLDLPKAAISTGSIDSVLDAKAIGEELTSVS